MSIPVIKFNNAEEWKIIIDLYYRIFPNSKKAFEYEDYVKADYDCFEFNLDSPSFCYYGEENDWELHFLTGKNKLYTFEEFKKEYSQYFTIENKKEKEMEKLMLDVLEKTYTNSILRQRTVPLFLSNPGIGKTSIIKKFSADKGVKMTKITLSQRMPNEVVGMMMPDINTGKLMVFDSYELESLNDGDILFFDEVFNGTLKQTLDAVLNLLEDRTLPTGKKLADVMILAASNPQGLINLTPQIKERFIRYDLEFNKEEFQNLLKFKYGMPLSISNHLCYLIEKEKFEHGDWNYCTPRSIEKAIIQLAYELETPYQDLVLPVLTKTITCPKNVDIANIKEGDEVEYLKLLKLIIKLHDNTNKKPESKVASHISG